LTKFEEQMAKSLESLNTMVGELRTVFTNLNTKVAGSEPVLQLNLNKLSAMESRQTKAEEFDKAILVTIKDATTHLQCLESSSVPPLPQQPPPRPPPPWVNPFEFTLAPSGAPICVCVEAALWEPH
jgi:hypothetical protein